MASLNSSNLIRLSICSPNFFLKLVSLLNFSISSLLSLCSGLPSSGVFSNIYLYFSFIRLLTASCAASLSLRVLASPILFVAVSILERRSLYACFLSLGINASISASRASASSVFFKEVTCSSKAFILSSTFLIIGSSSFLFSSVSCFFKFASMNSSLLSINCVNAISAFVLSLGSFALSLFSFASSIPS